MTNNTIILKETGNFDQKKQKYEVIAFYLPLCKFQTSKYTREEINNCKKVEIDTNNFAELIARFEILKVIFGEIHTETEFQKYLELSEEIENKITIITIRNYSDFYFIYEDKIYCVSLTNIYIFKDEVKSYFIKRYKAQKKSFASEVGSNHNFNIFMKQYEKSNPPISSFNDIKEFILKYEKERDMKILEKFEENKKKKEELENKKYFAKLAKEEAEEEMKNKSALRRMVDSRELESKLNLFAVHI